MKEQLMMAKALVLRDQVRVNTEPWPYCVSTVIRRDEDREEVTVLRPYVHTGDCEYAGNRVIGYLGFEEWSMPFNTQVIWLGNEGPVR